MHLNSKKRRKDHKNKEPVIKNTKSTLKKKDINELQEQIKTFVQVGSIDGLYGLNNVISAKKLENKKEIEEREREENRKVKQQEKQEQLKLKEKIEKVKRERKVKMKNRIRHRKAFSRKKSGLRNHVDLARKRRFKRARIENAKELRCFSCKEKKNTEYFYSYGYNCVKCTNEKFNENMTDEKAAKRMIETIKWRKVKRECNIDGQDVLEMYRIQEGKCSYSGRPIKLYYKKSTTKRNEPKKGLNSRYHDRASLDRIDSNRGYTKDNVHLVTFPINMAKNDYSHEAFIQLCRDVVQVDDARDRKIIPPLMRYRPSEDRDILVERYTGDNN